MTVSVPSPHMGLIFRKACIYSSTKHPQINHNIINTNSGGENIYHLDKMKPVSGCTILASE